ncbi:hypothetical protein [Gracilibacillus sp. JCM 18860]
MKDGIAHLKKAKSLNDQLEAMYMDAVDFSVIDEMDIAINREIAKLAKNS